MRSIDADALIERITNTADLGGWIGETLLQIKKVAVKYIENAPTIDAVEVVRCKDCKHRREICSMRYIEMMGEDERIHDYSTDNGYCSWGERREDGEA